MALIDGTGQVIAQTNCGTVDEARTIVRAAVAGGLAACGNIHGPVTSLYRWADDLVEAIEYVVVLKTTRARLDDLEQLVRAHHSYDLPAILILPIAGGEAAYLEWLDQSARCPPARSATRRR